MRELSHFPPFVDMLRVLVTSEDEERAKKVVEEVFVQIKQLREEYSSDFVYLNAMKCPKKRLQKNYRYEILMRIYKKSSKEIITKIHDICYNTNKKNVSLFIENDPQNLS